MAYLLRVQLPLLLLLLPGLGQGGPMLVGLGWRSLAAESGKTEEVVVVGWAGRRVGRIHTGAFLVAGRGRCWG